MASGSWRGRARAAGTGPRASSTPGQMACVSSLRRRRVEATVVTGEQIRRARELLGWTPYRLAPRAGIGHTLLRQFEKGARPIDAESAARLRAALSVARRRRPRCGSHGSDPSGREVGSRDDQRNDLQSLASCQRHWGVDHAAADAARAARLLSRGAPTPGLDSVNYAGTVVLVN